MLDKSKNYLIVGLGLLGGKYAQVLSQKGYSVTGITHSQATLDYALQHDYIRAGKNADPPRHNGDGRLRRQARRG